MYHIGTIQPHLPDADRPRDKTAYPTIGEAHEWADEIAERKTGLIPLTIDHAGGERPDAPLNAQGMFEVPPELQIGRVVDAVVRSNGDLLTISELFYDRPETHAIIDDLNAGREWGLSACTNLKVLEDEGRVLSKRFTHLGVTRNPEFGPENSWIHYAHTSWEGLDDTLQALMDREPDLYVPAATRARLRERQTRRGVRNVTTVATATTAAHPPSDQTGHLSRTAAPALALVSRPQSASPLTMADTTAPATPGTPASTTTPDTSAAAPAQQQQQQQLLGRFAQIHTEVDNRFSNVVDPQGNWNTDTFTPGNMLEAQRYMDRYGGLLKDAGLDLTNTGKWPEGTFTRFRDLNTFMTNATAHAMSAADTIMTDVPGGATPEMRAAAEYTKMAIQNLGARPEYLQHATQVMASHGLTKRNARAFQAQLLDKQTEFETKKAELEKTTAELKRSRDEWEADRKRLQTEYDAKLAEVTATANKRPLTETKAAAAAVDNKTNAAAVSVNTMASHNSFLPDLPNVRLSAPALGGWLKNLAAANTPAFQRQAALTQTATLDALRKPSPFAGAVQQ
jgi:Skp family chaperone for outer membrane proteins